MKTLLIVTLSLITLTLNINAQPEMRMNPEERAQRITKMLTDSLELNEDQTEKVLQIQLDHQKKIQEKRTEFRNTGRTQDRNAMRSNRQEFMNFMNNERKEMHQKMKNVLNEEQYEKYLDLELERAQRPPVEQNRRRVRPR